jgi:hypothetical protein
MKNTVDMTAAEIERRIREMKLWREMWHKANTVEPSTVVTSRAIGVPQESGNVFERDEPTTALIDDSGDIGPEPSFI